MFCEVDAEETKLESENSEAENIIDTINEILVQPICQGLTNAANAVLDVFAEAKQAYDIFVEKKSEMEQYRGYDKYYHAKANCEATELGTLGELTAHILSVAKEAKDIFKKTIIQGQDVVDVWNDSLNDIGADVYGIGQGHRCRYCDFTEEDVKKIFKGRIEKRNIFKWNTGMSFLKNIFINFLKVLAGLPLAILFLGDVLMVHSAKEQNWQTHFYIIFSVIMFFLLWSMFFVKINKIIVFMLLLITIIYLNIWKFLPSVKYEFDNDACLDIGICAEGLKFGNDIMSKDYCLKNHHKWNDRRKECNMRDNDD